MQQLFYRQNTRTTKLTQDSARTEQDSRVTTTLYVTIGLWFYTHNCYQQARLTML